MLFMLVTGYGLGNTMQPLMLAVQNSVAPRDIGVATASSTFFRQIGGTLGVAVFLSILFSTVGDKIAAALKAAAGTPAFQAAAHDPAIAGVQPNSDFLAAMQAQQPGKHEHVLRRRPQRLVGHRQAGQAVRRPVQDRLLAVDGHRVPGRRAAW